MNLSEKILYCRKKSALSQEALAEQLGVSRQAISKWETGDAVPELNKLLLLSKAFGVSTDWLLSEDAPADARADSRVTSEADPAPAPDAPQPPASWVDSIPGVIGKLIRRYGWLYGVYTALTGLGFTVIGLLARVLTRAMFSGFPFENEFHGTIWYDEAGNVIASPFGEQASFFTANNPVAAIGTVILVIGLVLIVAGITLAVYLKRKSNHPPK